MRLKLAIAAAVALVSMVHVALAQPRPQAKAPPKPTLADVQKVVQTIKADKAKMQAYCDLGKLNDQITAAYTKKDTKTAQSLEPKADALIKTLGPDYVKVNDGLEQVDENSADGKAFAAAFDALDMECK
jgi:hypothetical protein